MKTSDIKLRMYFNKICHYSVLPLEIALQHKDFCRRIDFLEVPNNDNHGVVYDKITREYTMMPIPPVLANEVRKIFKTNTLPLRKSEFKLDLDIYNESMRDEDSKWIPALEMKDFELSDFGEMIIDEQPTGIFLGRDTFTNHLAY